MTLAGVDAAHRISAPAGNLKICFLRGHGVEPRGVNQPRLVPFRKMYDFGKCLVQEIHDS